MNFPIVITLPGPVAGEAEAVRALAGIGAFVHVRKPGLEGDALRRYLDGLTAVADPSALSLHHQAAEAARYGFRGLHLRPEALSGVLGDARYDGLVKSVSCHAWEEVAALSEAAYAFLSPVFDSISKKGYKAAFDPEEIRGKLSLSLPRPRVVALGGIGPGNIGSARRMGFDGAAVLGALWAVGSRGVEVEKTLENYGKLRRLWEEAADQAIER